MKGIPEVGGEFPGGQRRIFREVIRSSEGKGKDL